jgi:hypothetical protein
MIYNMRLNVPTQNGVLLCETLWVDSPGAVKNVREFCTLAGWEVISVEAISPLDSTSALKNLIDGLKAAGIQPKLAKVPEVVAA